MGLGPIAWHVAKQLDRDAERQLIELEHRGYHRANEAFTTPVDFKQINLDFLKSTCR